VPCVLLFGDENFQGRSLALPPGEYPDLRLLGFNDETRSIKIKGKAHALVFVDVNYLMGVLPVNSSRPTLDAKFSSAISSIQVISDQ
jgi:Beta/Gamma crystallin